MHRRAGFSGNTVDGSASKLVTSEQTPAGAAAGQTIAFEDMALIERCRKGEMEAFGLLVAKYQDRIFNLVWRMCPREAEAEELAQEVFLKALENLDQFRGHSRFYTWLFRIATNLAISHRRRTAKIKFHSLGDGESPGHQAAMLQAATHDGNPGPVAAAISAETAARVAEALEELDEEHRAMIILRDVEDMDYTQIASVLDLPIGTVKSRLHRARCMLKDKLSDLV